MELQRAVTLLSLPGFEGSDHVLSLLFLRLPKSELSTQAVS